jgi:hypothetical protein
VSSTLDDLNLHLLRGRQFLRPVLHQFDRVDLDSIASVGPEGGEGRTYDIFCTVEDQDGAFDGS